MNFDIKDLIIKRKETNKILIIVAIISIILVLINFFVTMKLEIDLLFLVFLFLTISIITIYKVIDYNSEINQLEDNLKVLNDYQLNEISHSILYCRGEYIFTEENIYLLQSKKFIRYCDILLIYEKYNIGRFLTGKSKWRTLHNSFKHDRSMVVITVDKKAIRLCNDRSRFIFLDSNKSNNNFFLSNDKNLVNILKSNNSNILIGDTDANKKILKEKYGMSLDCLKYFG